jgi:uridylate kinase
MGESASTIDRATIDGIATQIADIVALGVQVGVVIGGGNIFRGVSGAAQGIDRAAGDAIGMLATCINALSLQDALARQGVEARVQSAIPLQNVAETFDRQRALRHLAKGRVVVFGGGTGNPYFTTDTAACLRALEIRADVVMKATKVDGVYTADPAKDPTAQRFEAIDVAEVLARELKVMDAAAISLCRDNDLPLLVFSMNTPGNIRRAVMGDPIGTLVRRVETRLSQP